MITTKDIYYRLKSQGLCVKSCGRKAEPGYIRCNICARKQNYHSMQHYKANRQYYIDREKKKKEERRKRRECISCGCKLIEDEIAKCVNCVRRIPRSGYAVHYKATPKRS